MADKASHAHDDLLGYVPRPGYHDHRLRIDSDSLRYTGEPPATDDPPILAVGDSYTFGEDVSDLEAWPAQLQERMGRRVLNAGVSGYGLDQIVLRAERLAAMHAPSVIIVGFIADDIRRTEMRRLWAHSKPWYALRDDKLMLQGVPVPPPRPLLPLRYQVRLEVALLSWPGFIQRLIGFHARVHPAGTGRSIAFVLVEQLAVLQRQSKARIVMLAQYDPHVWADRAYSREQVGLTGEVLGHAARHGLATLDCFRRFAAEPNVQALYGNHHLNARGNRIIAGLLAATLPGLIARPQEATNGGPLAGAGTE